MFNSILADEMKSFLELRKANVSPQTYAADIYVLTELDRCLTDNDYCEKNMSEDILNFWINTLHGKSKTVMNTVAAVRNFVKYLNDNDNRSFLPDAPKVKSDYIPYIFSDEELKLIFHHADNLNVKYPKRCSPFLLIKIPMILRILYGCGSRLGETLALKRKDIDFKSLTILFRNTKFSKERLIPVHEDLMNILERYCLTLGIMFSPDAYLFPGARPEQHFTKRQTASWFTEILKRANIDYEGRQKGERGACLHCFRHLFVLKSIQQLEAAGHPVDMNDMLLPTYLGHECLIDTDRYMKFSGAQIPESMSAFEAFTTGLIPKVEVPYEDE